MSQVLYKGIAVVVLIATIISCSVLGNIGQKHFDFYKDGKERKLVFRLPKGRVQENYRVGENGAKEQFYYLGDGSVFYVARQITWQTVNKHRIDAYGTETRQQVSSFSGIDGDGLYWKEIQLEDFKIGYAYVAPDLVERFNDVLNSIKIR